MVNDYSLPQAVMEPGNNWISKTFRWLRDMDPMPGWELTSLWLIDESMPKRGLLNITYYSGQGKGKLGCNPNVAFRKSLCKLVLVKERDLVPENMRTRTSGDNLSKKISAGDRSAKANMSKLVH